MYSWTVKYQTDRTNGRGLTFRRVTVQAPTKNAAAGMVADIAVRGTVEVWSA